MSSSQQTYTKFVPDMLLQAVGGIKNAGIALLAARLVALTFVWEKENGKKVLVIKDEVEVSVDSLCKLFCCSGNTIKKYAKVLSMLDVWQMKSGDGRSHLSIWKKGSNFATYLGGIKVSDFDTFSNRERYQTLTIKVSNFDTNNKDNNKEREGARTCVSTPSQHAPKKSIKKMQGDTPCDPQEIAKLMTPEFLNFWKEFHANPEYERDEKIRCANIWSLMSTLLREDILQSLRSYNARPTRFHLRAKKDNPRYFLQDYVPKSLKLAPNGAEVTYEAYVKFYGTTLDQDGWKRIHLPEEQRTIYRKEK